jgi:hypothetical protein
VSSRPGWPPRRADRPTRPRGRHGAKSDGLDAVRPGREALARDHLTTPRGHREALRVLHTSRAHTSRRIAVGGTAVQPSGRSSRRAARCTSPAQPRFDAGCAGHRRILGSCVGSAYMGGQPCSMASGRSS